MTSTVKVNNLRKSGESADRDISGVAAAWVNFNGTGVIATRDSLNVSSLTDNGAGDYSINFSNSFAVSGQVSTSGQVCSSSDIDNFAYTLQPQRQSEVLASSLNVYAIYVGASASGKGDYPHCSMSIHGDLA